MNKKSHGSHFVSIFWRSPFVFLLAALTVSGFLVSNQAFAVVSNIDIISPIFGDNWRGTQTIEWTADGSEDDTVFIYFSSTGLFPPGTLIGEFAYDLGSIEWNTSELTDSSNYKILITDAEAQFSSGVSVEFTVDNTPPVTTAIVNPEIPDGKNGWYVTIPTITLECEDNLSGCYKTFYRWDEGAFLLYSDPIGALEGENSLTFFSTDKATDKDDIRSQEEFKTLNIKVDTISPAVALTYNPVSPVKAGAVIMTAAYSEPVTSTPQISIDQPGLIDIKDAVMTDSGDNTIWTYIYTVNPADGSNYIDGEAAVSLSSVTDEAGNLAELPTGSTFIIDTTDPTITNFIAPEADAVYKTGVSIPIIFTPTDPAPGTDLECGYTVNGGVFNSIGPCDSGDEFSNFIDEEQLTDTETFGRNNVSAYVIDAAGNSFISGPVSIVFDNDDTLTVDDDGPADFDTIQEAIEKATAGDTIEVAAGTYDEQVVIDKSLTLQGVGDTTIIQPSGPELTATASIPWIGGGTGTMSAIVSIETAGDEVTIKNLKIDGSLITSKVTLWQGGLVYLETGGIIDSVTVNGGSTLPDRTAGIFAAAITNPVSLEVTGCTVEVYTRAGIYALGGTITADYNNNNINGPGPILGGVPNGMFFLEGAKGLATYNTVTDLGYTGETYRSTGIGTYNAGTDIVFSHNEISLVQNAFALSTGTVGTTVEYNDVHDSHTGIKLEAGATDSIIQYNDIYNNDFAIRGGGEMGDGNEAHYNNFVGNDGIEWEWDGETYIGAVSNVHSTHVFDAINNWWGSVNGPTHSSNTYNTGDQGDAVSDYVNFTPWLDGSYPGGSSFAPVTNSDTGEQFASIQTAIDDSDTLNGHIIEVVTGTYDEDVIVDKSLILNGAQAGVDARGRSASDSEIIGSIKVTSDASDVTIDGFKVTSTELGAMKGVGMFIESTTSATVKNNIFVNVDGSGYDYPCVLGLKGITNDVDVEYNDFSGEYDVARAPNVILLWELKGTITVANNKLYDVGGGGGIGILLPTENAVLNINNNVIDHTGDGMWLLGTEDVTLSIQSNSIYNNDGVHGAQDENIDTGVKLAGYGAGSNIAINYNNIYDNNLGMTNTGGLIIDAEKNWWGQFSGPTHPSNPDDPDERGDAVSNFVDFSPWCTEVPIEGACELGSNGPFLEFLLEFAPLGPISIPDFSELTVTAVDAGGVTLVNDTRQVELNGGGTTRFDDVFGPALINLIDGVLATNVTEITPGTVNVVAKDSGVPFGSATITFSGDETAPTLDSHTPADDATDVSVNIIPRLFFSEPLKLSTVSSDNIQLKRFDDDSVVPATVTLIEGGTQVTVAPDSPLDFEIQYYLSVSNAVRDEAGNVLLNPTTDKNNNEFITERLEGIILYNITLPSAGTANDTYLDGWHYVFEITVNNPIETDLFMKFTNWENTNDPLETVLTLGNTRLLSNTGAPVGNLTEADIEAGFSLGNDYLEQMPGAVDISGVDNNLDKAGRQVQLDVFVKIPVDTTPGFYTTEFSILTETP